MRKTQIHPTAIVDPAAKIAGGVEIGPYSVVGSRVVLGEKTTFHQHMRVGRLVMVQGSSAFGRDLPPFVMAAERNAVFGLNAIGLRRAGFDAQQREEIKRAFTLLYLSGLNLSQALEKARSINL